MAGLFDSLGFAFPELKTIQAGLGVATQISNAITPNSNAAALQRARLAKLKAIALQKARQKKAMSLKTTSPVNMRNIEPEQPSGNPLGLSTPVLIAGAVAIAGLGYIILKPQKGRK